MLVNLFELNRNFVNEIVLIRNSKTIRNNYFARGELLVRHMRKSLKKEGPWIKTLENSYCKNTRSRNYFITQQIFDSVLKGMENNEDEMLLPGWVATSKTILLQKNNSPHEAKNYRPIACQNIAYKIYKGIIKIFWKITALLMIS